MMNIDKNGAAEIAPPAPFSDGTSTAPNMPTGLSSRVATIVARVQDLGLALATRLDEASPDHPHGKRKHHAHVGKMVEELPGLCAQYKLSPEMSELATIVFSAHDLGRPVEALEKIQEPSKQHRTAHGAVSVKVMQDKNILRDLDPRQKFLVEFAVQYHCERSLPADEQIVRLVREAIPAADNAEAIAKEAVDLCYFLRDRDKVDILSKSADYLRPEFVAKELALHHFPKNAELGRNELFPEELAKSSDFKQVVLHAVTELLAKPIGTPLSPSGIANGSLDADVYPVITDLMNRGIETRTQQDFLDGKACYKPLVGHSWATYLLYASAFAFDLKHPATVKEVADKGLLDPWMNFVKGRVGPDEFSRYETTLKKYMESRIKELAA